MWYLDHVVNDFNPLHYYLASVAAEVRRGYVKDPDRVKVEDLLLKFISKEVKPVKKSWKERERDSMNAWFGAVGLEVPKE